MMGLTPRRGEALRPSQETPMSSDVITRCGFNTPVTRDAERRIGPWRAPRQMLADQSYEDHAWIHDDTTAQKFGFNSGTIEGPTRFSQFVPLAVDAWGKAFLASGCLSDHHRNAVFEEEEVQAELILPAADASHGEILLRKRDGSELLRGSVSVAGADARGALDVRLTALGPPGSLRILRDVHVGMRSKRETGRMGFDQMMGALYPFSLLDKLARITEPEQWHTREGGSASPWGRPIVPFEMISVLLNYAAKDDPFPLRGTAIGLFADQEVRLADGPLFVGDDYETDREIVAISDSRQTESMWVRSRVYRPGRSSVVASMLLNSASLKDSFTDTDA